MTRTAMATLKSSWLVTTSTFAAAASLSRSGSGMDRHSMKKVNPWTGLRVGKSALAGIGMTTNVIVDELTKLASSRTFGPSLSSGLSTGTNTITGSSGLHMHLSTTAYQHLRNHADVLTLIPKRLRFDEFGYFFT